MQQNRYHISESYNEALKCDMFYVLVNNSVIRSAHGTQREAVAAIKEYIEGDKRRNRQTAIAERNN
jgi:hypothetical protein